jgi:hypothetical protein
MKLKIAILILSAAITISTSAFAVSITALNVAYTEDFDTLASSGTSSTMPDGWALSETANNRNSAYTAGTGSVNTGDTYSFGAAGSIERALGGLRSGSLVPMFGVEFNNDTGSTINALFVAYTGEQWRLGTSGRTDRLDFQYSFDATSLEDGTWSDLDALDFSTPNSTGTVGARDGNIASNRSAVSASITELSVAPGSSFWFRWTDFDASGADDGLAIDDFSLTASSTPLNVPETLPFSVSFMAFAGILGLSRWLPRRSIR